MTDRNVINFPVRLDPALLDFEQKLIARAAERNIPASDIRRLVERVQPLYTVLSAPLAIEIPDTQDDLAYFKRIEEPIRRALIERLNEAIWAQLNFEAKRPL